MGFFRELFGGGAPPAPQEDLGAALMRLSRDYWTRAPDELARLEPAADSLEWAKLLRLHHLVCLELLHEKGLLKDRVSSDELADGPMVSLYVKTAARLSSAASPFRPRRAIVTQRARGGAAPKAPLEGDLRNASASHFGALEVILLKDNHPVSLNFVAFDDLASASLGPPSLFPPTKLQYEDGSRIEVVCLPLLYGASWFSTEPTDQNGSMTRFVGHNAQVQGGIGLGHQDFTCDGVLFGLGSVQQIDFPRDPAAMPRA